MTCIRCKHDSAKKFGKYGRHRIQRYRCISCKATFSEPKPETGIGNMRIDRAAAIRALQCLIEGCSIRSTERMTGLHRDTIMSLLVQAGGHCAQLMNERMKNLTCKAVE